MKNVFVRWGGDESFLYTVLRPGRDKIFSQALLEDFVPASCGQPPVSACTQADPARCPRPGKRCRRKHGSIPSRAYGRRRYNTLDLASKIVCHGNSLFPLDPLLFPSPALTKCITFRAVSGKAKDSDSPSVSMDGGRSFLLRFGFRFSRQASPDKTQNLAQRCGGTRVKS